MDWAFHESQMLFGMRAEREDGERLFKHQTRVLQNSACAGGGNRTKRPVTPEWKKVYVSEAEQQRLLHQARVLGWGKEKRHY
jgi:hypothetical protein